MEITFGIRFIGVLALVLAVSACGVDAPPVPPGQENPRDIQSAEDINPAAYF